ncbi:MAG: 3-phosphoshikimate 1-carboxyvinyltransferase, partial [Proteobacteria bacterium]|nr:3-phosphoshikimate 1-carboxyvinyltransferase [Pseudomonadota bacterium]
SFEYFRIKGNQKYKTINYSVEGDWSGASFLLIAGAVGGCVRVNNLDHHSSLQADKRIIDALRLCGAGVKIGYDNVEVYKNDLEGFAFDAEDCPDLFAPLVALICCCKGKSVISGVERLKHKESDRGLALQSEFTKLGAKIKISGNKMEIDGKILKGGEVNSHNDHRIAMACAIAGIGSKQGIKINDASCVSKSYPGFFVDLDSIIKAD